MSEHSGRAPFRTADLAGDPRSQQAQAEVSRSAIFKKGSEPLGICSWLRGRIDPDYMYCEKGMVPSLPQGRERHVGWSMRFAFVHGLEEPEI